MTANGISDMFSGRGRPLDKELPVEAKRLADEGASVEEILATLRKRGRSKLESTAAIAQGLGLGLAKSKRVVHESPTWADAWERDEHIFDDDGDGL